MERRTWLLVVFLAVQPLAAYSSSGLEEAVHELKAQVSELQKARQEDKATLELVLREVSLYGTDVHLNLMETASAADHSLEWRSQKSEEQKTNSRPSQHLEMEILRRDLSKLRKRVEGLEVEAKRESSTRAVVHWLQRGIADLRHEMVEMATSLNITAALTDQQRVQSQQELLRSDLTALGHRMDRSQVERQTNTASIQQIRRDLDELRTKSEQKRTLQNLLSEKSKFVLDGWTGKREKEVRHSHRKAEILSLYQSVRNLENEHSKLLESMRAYQELTSLKVKTLEKTCAEGMQAQGFEQQVTNQRIKALENLINRTDTQSLNLRSLVRNVTLSSLKKIDGPTRQALESLESNFERTTSVILQEISELDNNLSNIQSAVKDIRDRQIVTNEIISNIQAADQPTLSKEFPSLDLSNHKRTLKSKYKNIDGSHEKETSRVEAQIETLFHDFDEEQRKIEDLELQINGKVNQADYSVWEKTQQKLKESILELKKELPKIQKHQNSIESKLEKFTKQLPTDCSSLNGPSLILEGKSPTRVYCDNQWLVIQRRTHGDQSFNQNWTEYKAGFGDVNSDFWLGNQLLHSLTTSKDYILRIELSDVLDQFRYAEYSTFRVLGESDNYRLVLDGYAGNASNALAYHNGMAFSTPDRDHDESRKTHCARFYESGWWYRDCQYVNVNGNFSKSMSWYNIDGQEWSELSKVEMKIKLKPFQYV